MNPSPALPHASRGGEPTVGQAETGPGTAAPPCHPRPDLQYARGVIADMKDHPDDLLIAACETVIEQSGEHGETMRARALIEALT